MEEKHKIRKLLLSKKFDQAIELINKIDKRVIIFCFLFLTRFLRIMKSC